MTDFIREGRERVKHLRANEYFLKLYYGETLRDHPLGVAARLLLSRFMLVSHVPILLPIKHFLMRHQRARMYINPFLHLMTMDRALGLHEYWMARLFGQGRVC